MALKNRDLTFIIKVQNSAKAALKSLRDDLTATGKAGKGMGSDLDKVANSFTKLRDSAKNVGKLAQGIEGVTAATKRSTKAAQDDGAARVRIAATVQRAIDAQEAANKRTTSGANGGPVGTSAPGSRTTAARSTEQMRGTAIAAAAASSAGVAANARLIVSDGLLARAYDRVRDTAYQAYETIKKGASGGIGGGIDALKEKFNGLSGVMKGVAAFAGFSLLANGLRLAGAAVVAPIKAYADFTAEMSRVQAVAQATAGELKPLSAAALDVSTKTGLGATDAAAALKTLIQNGLSAADAIKLLRPAADFAAVGELTLAEAADTVTKTLAQYQLPVEQAAHATDILNFVNVKTNTSIRDLAGALSYAGPVANAAKISLAETAAVIGVLGDAGIKGSAGGTAVRSLLLDLTELANGIAPKKAQELFKNLKIDPKFIDPSKVGLTKALEKLKEAKLTLGELNVLFQKRGATPAAVLLADPKNGQQQALDKAKQLAADAESAKAADFNKKQADIARNNLTGDLAKMKAALINFGIAIVNSGIGTALRAIVQGITDVVAKTSEFLKFLFDGSAGGNALGAALVVLAGAAVLAIIPFGALTGAILTATGAFIGFTLALLLNPLVLIAALIAATVAAFVYFGTRVYNVNGTLASGWDILRAAWAGVVAYFGATLNSLGDAFSQTFTGIANVARGIGNALASIATGDSKGLEAAIAQGKAGAISAAKAVNIDAGAAGAAAYNKAFASSIAAANSQRNRKTLNNIKEGGDAFRFGTKLTQQVDPLAEGDAPNRFGGGGRKKAGGKSDAERAAEEAAKTGQNRHDLIIKENLDLLAQEGLIGRVGVAREKFTKTTEFLNKIGLKGIEIDATGTHVISGLSAADTALANAIIARTSALVDAQRVDKVSQAIYDDATSALTTYNDTLAAATKLVKDHPEAQEAATRAVNKAKIALDAYLDPLTELRNKTRDLIALSNVRASALELETKVQEVYNTAIAGGASAAEAAKRATDARPEFARQAAAQARIDLNQKLTGINQEIALAGVLAGEQDKISNILSYQADLIKTGITDQGEINKLVGTYADALERLETAKKRAANDGVAGVREGLQAVKDQFTGLRSAMSDLVTSTFDNLSSGIQNLLKTGKFSFKDFIQTLSSDVIKKGVDSLLSSAAGGIDGLLGKKDQTGAQVASGGLAGLLGAQQSPAAKAGVKLATDLGIAYSATTTGVGNEGQLFVNNLQVAFDGLVAQVQAIQVQPGAGGILSGSTGIGGGAAAIGGDIASLFSNKAANDNPFASVKNILTTDLTKSFTDISATVGKIGGGFTTGFGGVLQNVLSGLASKAGGAGLGGIVGSAISIASTLFKFSDGGIMTDRGQIPLRKYSGGGIARSPQLAMFGEGSTPEAYVPVPSGRIPVQISGGGKSSGDIVIAPQITIPISGGGGGMSQEQAASASKALEGEMGKFIERWAQKEQRPGGRLASRR